MTLWWEEEVKGCDCSTWTAFAATVREPVLFARQTHSTISSPFQAWLPDWAAWLDMITGEWQPRREHLPTCLRSLGKLFSLQLLCDLWNKSFSSLTSFTGSQSCSQSAQGQTTGLWLTFQLFLPLVKQLCPFHILLEKYPFPIHGSTHRTPAAGPR